jgi:hypothetical protein
MKLHGKMDNKDLIAPIDNKYNTTKIETSGGSEETINDVYNV